MKLMRSMSYYTGTAVLNGAVPFLLLPVLTRHMTPSDFGLIAAVAAYIALLSPAIVMGLPTLFSVDFNRLGRPDLRRKSAAWLGLVLTFGISFIAAAWLFRERLAIPLAMPAAWVPVVPVLALFSFIPQWASVMFRVADRPKSFAAYETVQAMLQLATAFIFVVPLGMQWEGRIWSMLLCGIVANIAGILCLRPYLTLAIPRQVDLQEAVKFGFGLLPHSIFSHLIRLTDRLFVIHFIGLAAAGQFAVGWQVASIMLVLLSTFNQAWTPYLFKALEGADKQDRRDLVILSYKIALCFVALFALINALSPLIFKIFISKEFHEAQRFVPFITVAYLFMGFYMLFTDYIFYSKKTHLLSILTTANALINLILSYVCIQRFGAIGVTYSFAASSAFVALAAWLLAQKVHPMPWFSSFAKVRRS